MPSNVLLIESSNVMVSIFLIHCSAIQIQISERYLLKGQKLMLLKIILVTLKSWERMTFPSLSILSCPNPKKSSSMGTLLHWDDRVQVSHFSGLFPVPLWFLAVHGQLFIFSHKTRLLDYLSLRCIWCTSFVIFSHRWVACISSERILSQGASGTTSTCVMVLLTSLFR